MTAPPVTSNASYVIVRATRTSIDEKHKNKSFGRLLAFLNTATEYDLQKSDSKLGGV